MRPPEDFDAWRKGESVKLKLLSNSGLSNLKRPPARNPWRAVETGICNPTDCTSARERIA
jgi:hypothetical protein